ncbi:MAG: phosphoenolpyruvate--protein phosphotransferase [Azospirillaceae bacterium]
MRTETTRRARAAAFDAARGDVDPGGAAVFNGLGVAAGIAIGPAHVVDAGAVPVPEYAIPEAEREAELARLQKAVDKSRRQISKLKAKAGALPEAAAEEIAYLLDAHMAFLSGSRLLRGAQRRIAEDGWNAEYAVQSEIGEIAGQFESMHDSYLAGRIQDVRDVGDRLIRNLAERKYETYARVDHGSILIAEEITPADTALMDPARVAGFATTLGGAEGHTAIMARSLGLPAVLGVAGLVRGVRSGQTIIVDGTAGRVVVDPDAETLAHYVERRAALEADREQLRALIALPARTRDGVTVPLHVNLELPREIAAALTLNVDGVGLLRTEFQFMNREDLPGEDEQYEALRGIVEGMEGRPVTLRTLDVGGEKIATALGDDLADAPNPALGLRAIRLSLRRPALLDAQLRAMLRAGAHGPIRILLPMIVTPAEVRAVRAAMETAAEDLRGRGTPIADPLPPVGSMIEIPGAAVAADALATVSDFFAIGTNDLIMYTLAIDRGDEQVADLYDPLHPAVLRLIQFAAAAARRAGIPISVCGEMAGEPRYTPILLGLGIRELSMSPTGFLRVKRRLRALDLEGATNLANAVMAESDRPRIAALVDDFEARLGGA